MTDFLLIIFVLLGAGVIAVPIASRLGLGSVLGYLIAGIAVSPILSALHVDVVAVQHFAEFGVVMMLFLVGLELEADKLWKMRGRLLGLGGLQVTLTALLFMGIAMLLGYAWSIALAVGLILCVSSTAIILQTLNEKGLMKSDGGQNMFSVLLFQDIAVIPMLAVIPLLALPELTSKPQETVKGHGEDTAHFSLNIIENLNAWQSGLVTLAAVALIVLIGYYATRPVFRFVAWAKLRELFTATAILIVVAIALLMTMVGLSPALGTFLAGVVLASSAYRHELESTIDPIKGLLLGIFFMTVGASIDFSFLIRNGTIIAAMTMGVIAFKALILYGLARLYKIKSADRWLFSLGLAQAGEFGFVLISLSLTEAVIPMQLGQLLSITVAMSMLLTPALFIVYDRIIAPHFSSDMEREADTVEDNNHIIIAGHGRMGGIVNRILGYCGYTTTVLDFSSEQLELIRTFDLKAYFGDATRPDLLHAAGIEEAEICVIAIDERENITRMVEYLHKTYPQLHIIARAVDRHHVYELWYAGCRDIIRETYDSSLRMGRSVLEAIGMTRSTAQSLVDQFEHLDREAMVEAASLFDPTIPVHENAPYIALVKQIEAHNRANIELGRLKPGNAAKVDEAEH